MGRFAFVAGALVACSSPDVCDQNVMADIVQACFHHAGAFGMSGGSGAFTCAGGGSGSGTFTGFGPNSIYHAMLTFNDCTENVGDDSLTLTGTLMMQGDTVNSGETDSGHADMFTIRGTVAGCGSVNETCTLSWGPKEDNYGSFYRSGTVCGRQFP